MKTKFFSNRAKRLVASALLLAFAAFGAPVHANPSGGVVVQGIADIQSISASQLQIHQKSALAVINWNDFSIGAGELTNFVQPSANSAVLNRVTSGNISHLQGMLKANGNVFVINPNGIVISSDGVIDVGGSAVISTLDIDDNDFMDGGTNRFYGDSTTGVSNFGTIASAGGDVILLGGFVDNKGAIGALDGTIALGSGGDILVNQAGESLITVQGASDYDETGLNNSGSVRGASVEMKSHGNVYALAINNTGVARATGATRSNGRVRLMASGGSGNINLGQGSSITAQSGASGGDIQVTSTSGNVTVAGDLIADGSVRGGSVAVTGNSVTQTSDSMVSANGVTNGGTIAIDSATTTSVDGAVFAAASTGAGGSIDVTATEVEIGSQAVIGVDGTRSGGRIRIGGEFRGTDVAGLREADLTTVSAGAVISADASLGDAGSVIVWANQDTIFRGDVSASAFGATGSGGLVEISGLERLALGGSIAANAVSGDAGTVLFDPGTINIGYFNSAAGFNEIEIATVNELLEGGTSVLIMTEDGDIIFDDVDLAGMQAGGQATGGSSLSVIGATNNSSDYTNPNHPRNLSIQWTNSKASFGALASGDIIIENHIRTSGGGSINLIAGWGGTEADFAAGGGLPFSNVYNIPANGLSNPSTNPPAVTPQEIFNYYVAAGQFAENSGSIFVGRGTMDRHVEVGSRFGDTSLAAFSIFVTAADTNDESRWAQVGFHDSGQVFGQRFNNVNNAWDPDLDLRGLETSNDPNSPLYDNPAVGIAGMNERDIDGDGLVDGVYAVNLFGVLDGTVDANGDGGISTEEANGTFIPYANHYNSSRLGNWWWQQIHEHSKATRGVAYSEDLVGGLRPENGAGTVTKTADINLIAAGNVEITSGGRTNSSATVGHGGDSAGWADNRSILNGGIQNGEFIRRWSMNGASNDRSAMSIARLNAVHGNINVLAGVDPTGVTPAENGVISATSSQSGRVVMTGLQRLGSRNNPGNDEQASGSDTPAQIGHGGSGQFGTFHGDIQVQANGDIDLIAGSQTRSSASIGHQTSGYAYWDPTSNADAQIRFFGTNDDFRDPLLRRGELFSGTTNIAQNAAGDTYFPGTDRRGGGYALSEATTGVDTIEALDGSVVNHFDGDITVKSVAGDLNLIGFETEDTSEFGSGAPGDLGLASRREDRYARVGHGGNSFAVWAEESGYTENRTDRFQELVNFRIQNEEYVGTDLLVGNTGSNSIIGERGTSLNRALTFMTLTGNIDADVAGDVQLKTGNGNFDVAQIGHGGYELADYETSSLIAGDITVNAGGDITITGVTEASTFARRNGTRFEWEDTRNYTLIGHGGYRSGFLSFSGKIDVDAGGDISLTGGIYEDSLAKIGHQTTDDWGQTGGNFDRAENFYFDSESTDITTSISGNTATITYAGGINQTITYNIDNPTSDIEVDAGGAITLKHSEQGLFWNARAESIIDEDLITSTDDRGYRIDKVGVQIGHGGINADILRYQNLAYDDGDKIGDITVNADGDINLENGNGTERWTRIGHGLGDGDRADGNNANYARNGITLVGDIGVTAGGSISLNADAAAEYGNAANSDNAFGIVDPSEYNPVVIGHGGIRNNLDIVTLSGGEDVNGTAASSDILVVAAGALELLGGKGAFASSAQIGHGYASDLGNDPARLGGAFTGFAGDITVNVGTDLTLLATSNAWYEVAANTILGASTVGGFAAIGNGGYQLDAPASGDISVYVGGSASISGSQRTEAAPGDPGTDNQTIVSGNAVNQNAVGSGFHFAKIGHIAVENQNGANQDVINADQTGNVTVVVENDLNLKGGTTVVGVELAPVFGAFAQIGNGGPGVTGDIEGNLTVLVGGDVTAEGGVRNTAAATIPSQTAVGLNNYVMIGNGDRIFRPGGSTTSVFQSEAFGARSGDIIVAIGGSGDFTDMLIGHADPNVSLQATSGDTQIAVSRKFPFYGGTGSLTAADSVFTSGGYGSGSQLEIYIPSRSMNLIENSTLLNEGTGEGFEEAPADFATPFAGSGQLSGRDDEVYLTPDLWWDDATFSAGLTDQAGVFPTDASGDPGGSVATVTDPGGVFNIDALVAGALGSSATVYRDGNGVSGAGNYTIYYDAIEPVASTFGTVIPIVVIDPIAYNSKIFSGFFEAFERNEDDVDDGIAGDDANSLFASVGLFESDEEAHSESEIPVEEALDAIFGPRTDRFSDEEIDEDDRRRRRRAGQKVGPIGTASYVYYPGTSRYSSLRIFGAPVRDY